MVQCMHYSASKTVHDWQALGNEDEDDRAEEDHCKDDFVPDRWFIDEVLKGCWDI